MIGLLLMLLGLLFPDGGSWSLRLEVFRCAIILAGAAIMVAETLHYLRWLFG